MTSGARSAVTVRRLSSALVAAVAHGLFFIWYQRPDWTTQWSDQDGYRRLGQVLAATGKFTRFPDAPPFVPEVIRTPVYPLFVAAIYQVAGVQPAAGRARADGAVRRDLPARVRDRAPRAPATDSRSAPPRSPRSSRRFRTSARS